MSSSSTTTPLTVTTGRADGLIPRGHPAALDPLRLLRRAWSRGQVDGLASGWRALEVFCDHHGLDPEAMTDEHLVAFTLARANAGISWGSCSRLLWLYRAHVEGDARLRRPDGAPVSVTVPAVRLLTELWDDGRFDPQLRQAPLVTLGEVLALVEAAGRAPAAKGFDAELVRARDVLLVTGGYVAGFRPGEWSWIDLEHVEVRDGTVRMWLPETKTGQFQQVVIESVGGLDVAEALAAYLEVRGDEPGPLIVDGRGHGPRRVAPLTIGYRLRVAAAQAGITAFAPYSLRRSMAAHQQLLGAPTDVIRQRLRHSRTTSSFRRYVEPMLVVMGKDEARAHWLDSTVPELEPVAVSNVRGAPEAVSRAKPLAFQGGTLDDLLAEVDLPSLRVPARLAETAEASLESARRTLRSFLAWGQENDVPDPTAPRQFDAVRWVQVRLGKVQPQSVLVEVDRLELGLVDATGRQDWPELATARAIASGALSAALDAGEIEPRAKRKKSRPVTDEDTLRILPECPEVWPQAWALALMRHATGGAGCTNLWADGEVAGGLVAGEPVRWKRYDGVLCPVRAVETLLAVDVDVVNGGDAADVAVVFAAARSLLSVLRDRMVLTFAHGSGARPSDLARARTVGMQVLPNGLLLTISAEKGSRPGSTGRVPTLWAPHRDDDLDPVAVWEQWTAAWPFPDGPLVPNLKGFEALAQGRVVRLSGSNTGQIATARWRELGISTLSFYGFRYGRAGLMHDAGFTDVEIAEALNHDHLETTRGYIADYDVFADIDRGRDPIVGPGGAR